MTNPLLKFEVVYWLVAGVTAFFSFSLPGLVLAAFGNVYIRDGLSLARGISILWFIVAAAPLLGEPTLLQKGIGTLGLLAALVIFFLSYAHIPLSRQAKLFVIIYSALVAAVTLFLLWTSFNLQSSAWIPAIIFLVLSVYSFLTQKTA
jgi:hypothetical protein